MARIVLVTGGGRSGKSSYALQLGTSLPGPRAFLATCPRIDGEMRQRILEHQQERASPNWCTIEEPLNVARLLASERQYQVVLVDCLALWVNNLMHEAAQAGHELQEEDIRRLCGEMLARSGERPGTVIFVTNEVGMGIIPDNALARRYRDLLGRCNQVMAAGAETVILMTCGIPLTLKTGANP